MFTGDHSSIYQPPQLSPLLATRKKPKDLKSMVCHTYEKIPGGTPGSRPPYRQRVPSSDLSLLLWSTKPATRNTSTSLFHTLAPVSPLLASLGKTPYGGRPSLAQLLKFYLKCRTSAAPQFLQMLSGEK